jgi:hypothetical protein
MCCELRNGKCLKLKLPYLFINCMVFLVVTTKQEIEEYKIQRNSAKNEVEEVHRKS